jgi:hypothetical protein
MAFGAENLRRMALVSKRNESSLLPIGVAASNETGEPKDKT